MAPSNKYKATEMPLRGHPHAATMPPECHLGAAAMTRGADAMTRGDAAMAQKPLQGHKSHYIAT